MFFVLHTQFYSDSIIRKKAGRFQQVCLDSESRHDCLDSDHHSKFPKIVNRNSGDLSRFDTYLG